MINPNLLTDSLATKVAMEVVLSSCEEAVRERLSSTIGKELQDILAVYANEAKRGVFFEKLLLTLSSHERKFASMMQGIWEEQRRIIVANLKKMKKAWLQKGKIDELLYPRKQFEQKIARETKNLFEPIMEERAKEELDKIERELRKPQKAKQGVGVVGAFDVENPEVQKWLNDYTAKFSEKLETVSTDKLRSELIEGMKEGEGVPQLIKRVNTTYDNWDKVRSETIARSEAMRASNRGAIESYRQSGVVKSKIWITYHDKRTCYSCADLDGKVIALEENFFNLGDADEVIERGGRTYTFKNDYEDIGSPPRHARCRCTIAANFEDISRMKPWKPARTIAEAKKYALKNIVQTNGKVDYRNMALEGINIMNKELAMLVGKFKIRPTYIGSWKGFRAYAAQLFGDRWPRYRGQFKMPTNAWASYMEVVIGNTRVTGIITRDEWWTKAGFEKLKESLIRCVENGFHKYSGAADIFHHEYAHFLDHTIGITRQPMFREKYMELLRAGAIKEKISGYAHGDLSGEAWAELYANYKNGYYLRTKQPKMQYYVETIVKFIEARTR